MNAEVCEEKGKYYATNGYQLLDGRLEEYSDAVVQCAVFKGTSRNIFITRKEFTGCIDEEIEAAFDFVLEHINLGPVSMVLSGRIFMSCQFVQFVK